MASCHQPAQRVRQVLEPRQRRACESKRFVRSTRCDGTAVRELAWRIASLRNCGADSNEIARWQRQFVLAGGGGDSKRGRASPPVVPGPKKNRPEQGPPP